MEDGEDGEYSGVLPDADSAKNTRQEWSPVCGRPQGGGPPPAAPARPRAREPRKCFAFSLEPAPAQPRKLLQTFTSFAIENSPCGPHVWGAAMASRSPGRARVPLFLTVNPTLSNVRRCANGVAQQMTKITLEIESVVAMRAAGIEQPFSVDLSTATDPQAAATEIFRYGLLRWLNDKTGGAGQSDAERTKRANERIHALLTGTLRHRTGGSRLETADHYFRLMVGDWLRAKFPSLFGKAVAAKKAAAGSADDLFAAIAAKFPAVSREKFDAKLAGFREEATKMAESASDDADDDLDDLI